MNFDAAAAHRRSAAGADRARCARRTPPCSSRRPAPARPRACRWCWRTSRGRRAERSSCWSRAGSRRAPPPTAWRRPWASAPARRSACACASARRCRRKTRIEVVTEGVFTRLILDDPELKGVAAVLFDEFHERSLDADLGLALARDAQQGLREDLKILVMSATIDGARVAALLGDAPVIESAGQGVSGRDALRRARSARAHRGPDGGRGDARAARRAGLGAGVPAGRGGNPPHRNAAAASASMPRPTWSRSTARSMPTRRTARSRPRRRAGARSCSRPPSPRPRSPSRACASWSTPAWRACRVTSRTSA